MTKRYEPLWRVGHISALELRAINNASGEEVLSPAEIFGSKHDDLVRFEIPKFQRGLRWTKKKRMAFAESLRRGHPIGTMTFARKRDTPDQKVFFVLDGQQRMAAMSLIIEGFWKDSLWVLDGPEASSLTTLTQALNSEEEEEIRTAIDLILQTEDHDNLQALGTDDQFVNKIAHTADLEVPALESEEFLQAQLATRVIRDSLGSQFDSLCNCQVALQLIDAGKGETAENSRRFITQAFENLNANIQLSKNELLAARWEHTKISWPPVRGPQHKKFPEKQWAARNKQLMKVMQARISSSYAKLEDLGYEYDPNFESVTEHNVSLFDWLYGLSTTTNRTGTFEPKDTQPAFNKSNKIEELGFDTLSLLLTGRNTPNSEVFETAFRNVFIEDGVNGYEVGRFQSIYFEACKEINSALSPIRNYVGSSSREEPLGKIAATTYLAYYIALQYNTETFSKKTKDSPGAADATTPTQDTKTYLDYLKTWWLLDELQDTFVGSAANTNAESRVWAKFELKQGTRRLDEHMLQPAPLDQLLEAFRKIFVDEIESPQASPQRRSFKRATRVLTTVCFSTAGGLEKTLENDHLIPWKAIKSVRPPDEAFLPLNHPANFAPIDSKINNNRKNTPWAVYFDSDELSDSQRTLVRQRLLLDPSEFTADARKSPGVFNTLMLRRWTLMVFKALDTIDHPHWQEKTSAEKVDHLDNELVKKITEQTNCKRVVVEELLTESGLI